MRRREAILAAMGLVPASPLVLSAQPAAPPLVAFLGIATPQADAHMVAALRLGLEQAGHVIGRTIDLDARSAGNDMARFASDLAAVVARGARVVVVPGLAAAFAVRRRRPDLPVVAAGLPATVVDPDLSASRHRPGGSVTGFSHFGEDLAEKRVELLREIVPGLTTVAILHNRIDPLYRAWGERTEAAAAAQGLRTLLLGLETPEETELAAAMQTAREAGARGLVVVRDFVTSSLQAAIADHARSLGIATMAEARSFVDAGALLSYGASVSDLFRRAADYVTAILAGADPADLPIQLATRFELILNLRTARALGLEVPPAILLRADEVIE
jgi:putative ABC transport system substrate-binding protein